MAHQRATDRRPARQRHHPGRPRLPADPRRTPPRMLPPHRRDPRLHQRGHLMRARRRPRRPVRQPPSPSPAYLRSRPCTVCRTTSYWRATSVTEMPSQGHFQHGPVPLLYRTQLRQHTRLPLPRPPMDRREAASAPETHNQDGVSSKSPDHSRPATGTASANCRPGGSATWSTHSQWR